EAEQDPNRHLTVFGMIEAECNGTFEDLIEFLKGMAVHLGISTREKIVEIDYLAAADKYGVREIGAKEEMQLYHDFGPAVLLKNFPEHTYPYYNMERDENTGLARKTDFIICGQE